MLKTKTAAFRSQSQADAIAEILDARNDVLLISATGTGKTLCVLLPVFVEGFQKCTVFITPFVALGHQWILSCRKCGISVSSWADRNQAQVQLYVFALEHVGTAPFMKFLRKSTAKDLLVRIVIDEAQEVIISDVFRPKMRNLASVLNSVTEGIQRVLLSATIPPSERVRAIQGPGVSTAMIYSSSTVRKNLAFSVILSKPSQFEANIKSMAEELKKSLQKERRLWLKEAGRALVFVLRKADIEIVEQCLSKFVIEEENGEMLVYHANMNRIARENTHRTWKEATQFKFQVMICTSPLSAGIDIPDVRIVYHLGGCRSLIEFTQEVGRAGRDGAPAKCITIFSQSYTSKFQKFIEKRLSEATSIQERDDWTSQLIRWTEVSNWMIRNDACRTRLLYTKMDGIDPGLCVCEPDRQNCDFCSDLARRCVDDSLFENIREPSSIVAVVNIQIREHELVKQKDKHHSMVANVTAATNSDPSVEDMTNAEGTINETGRMNGLGNELLQQAAIGTNVFINSVLNASAEEQWIRFSQLSRRLCALCISCMVRNGRRIQTPSKYLCNHCSILKEGCHRCLSQDHRNDQCPLPRWVHNHCNTCGINTFDGIDVHKGKGFAKKCELSPLNKLFWSLWWTPVERKVILDQVCEGSFRQKMKEAIDNGTVSGNDEIKNIHSWLHNPQGIPNHARVALMWAEKNQLLREP